MSRLALLWFIGSLPAQTWVEFEGRAWFSQVNSRIRVERNTLGTEIDAKNDLGFTNSNFPEGRASLHVGNSRFSFDYTPSISRATGLSRAP